MPGVAALSLLGLSAASRTTPGLLFLYRDPPALSVMLRLCSGENAHLAFVGASVFLDCFMEQLILFSQRTL